MPRISNVNNKVIKKDDLNKSNNKVVDKEPQDAHIKPFQGRRATKGKDTTYYAKGIQLNSVMVYSKGGSNGIEYANEKIAMYNCEKDKLIVYNPSLMHTINYNTLIKISNKMWNDDSQQYH